MRHAKSSWDDPQLSDEDRPLSPRGRKAAARMAEYIKGAGIEPSLMLCSSALRARQTVDLLKPAFPKGTKIKIEPRLYSAGSKELLARIRRLSPAAASVLIVGHNPAIQDLILDLAAAAPELKAIRSKFPTAAIAVLEADRSQWDHITPGDASLVDFVTPKRLRG